MESRGEPRQLVEPRRGGAGVDRLTRELEPFAQVLGVPGRRDRAGRVQEDRVAPAAVRSREDVADRLRVLGRRAAAELGRVAALDAELERIDHALVHRAVDDLADEVRAGGGELVDPVRAVDDERAARTELREHLGDRPHERGRVDADHLRPRAGGVRERTEHVEHGTRRQLASHRRRVAHRRVMRRREHEAEAELVDRLLDPLRRLLEREAERLEHVRRARGRRDGAVAVLRHAGACRRGDERRRRRDVERARAVAARAGGVDEVVALRPDGEHVRAHRLRTARDLVRGLALEPQRDEEAADLGRRRVAAHDLVHHLAGLLPRERAAVEQVGERRPGSREEVPAEIGAERRQHALRMELDAFDRQLAVADAHHLAVGVRAETSSSSGILRAASEW